MAYYYIECTYYLSLFPVALSFAYKIDIIDCKYKQI